MSLLQKIQLLVSLLLVGTLATVLKINFTNAQNFSADHLYNGAKNSANVLALSLGSQTDDPALMATSINAMFDGGYFAEISLVNQDGKLVYQKKEPVQISGVPAWFVSNLNLSPPIAETQVVQGWHIFGTLRVQGHPGDDYVWLWLTFKQLCLRFALLALLATSASYFGLKYLLKSLDQIRAQAEAITNNEFIISPTIPAVPELKRVTLAMNSMVSKVQGIYQRELESLKNYHELLYKDNLTGLYNRRYALKQLGHFLEGDDAKAFGTMLILGVEGLENIRLSAGHPVIQKFHQQVAASLALTTAEHPQALLTRLQPQEYAVILPGAGKDQAVDGAQCIVSHIQQAIGDQPLLADTLTINGGLTAYSCGDSLGSVLARADHALASAKAKTTKAVVWFAGNSEQPLFGKFEWRNLIEEALENKGFEMTGQPVLSADGSQIHREVFVTMIDQTGEKHAAGYFMPMAMSLGLAERLELHVLEMACHYLSAHQDEVLAVNISADFLKDRSALSWLKKLVVSRPHLGDRLFLEIPESVLTAQAASCRDFAEQAREIGLGFGLDLVTLAASGLDQLQELRPHYIKVDQDYLLTDNDLEKNAAGIKALLAITESLGIILVAREVESQEQQELLTANDIKYFQGPAIAAQAPLGQSHD